MTATVEQYNKVIEDLHAYRRGLDQGIKYIEEMRDALQRPPNFDQAVCVVDISRAPVLASLLKQPITRVTQRPDANERGT